MATWQELAARRGYAQMEDGRWQSPDGESVLDADQMSQLGPAGYDFTGPDGRTYMVTADRGWNDPAAPGRYGLTAADTALAPDNANPEWMPGDRGVLYDKAPQYSRSSVFDFGPFLVAALAAPAIAGALAAPAAGAAGLGDLGWAANLVDAAGGSLAAPELAGSAYAGLGEGGFSSVLSDFTANLGRSFSPQSLATRAGANAAVQAVTTGDVDPSTVATGTLLSAASGAVGQTAGSTITEATGSSLLGEVSRGAGTAIAGAVGRSLLESTNDGEVPPAANRSTVPVTNDVGFSFSGLTGGYSPASRGAIDWLTPRTPIRTGV